MTWTGIHTSNDKLVDSLIANNTIHSPPVIKALRETDRSIYCPKSQKPRPQSGSYNHGVFADAPQSIGYKQTISAPFIHATALEALFSHSQTTPPTATPLNILDVGSGSGIMVAYLQRLFHSATVTGVEVIPQLCEISRQNLISDNFTSPSTTIINGNGWTTTTINPPPNFQLYLCWCGC